MAIPLESLDDIHEWDDRIQSLREHISRMDRDGEIEVHFRSCSSREIIDLSDAPDIANALKGYFQNIIDLLESDIRSKGIEPRKHGGV